MKEYQSMSSDYPTKASYSVNVIEKAYELYLTTRKTFPEIAKEVGSTVTSVTVWAGKYKWRKRRQQYIQDMMERSELECQAIIQKERARVMREQLDTSKKIRTKMVGTLDQVDTVDTQGILDISRAHKSNSDVEARIIQINAKAAGGGVTPGTMGPVVVNIQPIAQATDKPQFIDAEEAEEEPAF